jgi:glycosyltransferase involved in cell wall biosynthesis
MTPRPEAAVWPPSKLHRAPIWNVCLTHDPALAGLYRGINDFSRGLDAPILSFDDGRRPRAELIAKDGAVRIPCGPGRLARDCHIMPQRAASEAAAMLEAADLVVVHSMFRAHAPWAARWAVAHRRRYWSVPHGCLDPWGLTQRGLAKRIWLTLHGRQFLAGAERIVFSTQRGRDKARPWVRGNKAVVVHWPVDCPQLDDRDQQRQRFREEHGIPAEAPVLLFVGRLHRVKRPLETVRLFCTATGEQSHLLMVCVDGELTKADLAAMIPAHAADRVHLIGPLAGPDLAAAYLASDAFISLSFQENFGYAAAEAIAYGLPVILSPGHDLAHDLPCTPAGRIACGWLLPDDSATAAAHAIAEWAALASGTKATRARLVAMGSSGRSWVEASLGFGRFRDTLRSLAAPFSP